MTALISILAALLLLAALYTGRHRPSTALALALAVLVGASCDGCRAHTTAGPLRPDAHTRFHVSDRLGSSALVLDVRGEVIARDAFQPFGEPWATWRSRGASSPTYRFTGKEHDPRADAVAIGARHYLPAIGRWASPDPLYARQPAHRLERPDERNLYRYAGNSPVTHVDPSGTSVWTKLAKVGGKLLHGASVAEAFAGTVQDVRTLTDPNASAVERLVAGASLGSELLPLSLGDAKDAARWGQKALKAAPEYKALAAATGATRSARLAASVKWKGFAKKSEARHFQKHGSEFGDITQGEYKRRAKAFATETGDFQETVVGNFIIKHDPATRRTLIGHARKREIRTFYRADARDADPFAAAVQRAKELGGG